MASAVCGLTPAYATSFQDIAALQLRVSAFVGDGGSATVDPRLRLKSCTPPPEIVWQGERGNALAVSCADTPGWRIFVPVRRSGSGSNSGSAPVAANSTKPVAKAMLVATRPLARGSIISAADFQLGGAAANFPDALTRPEDAIGRTTTRPIMAGMPLRAGSLAAPRIVKRGDPVRINAGGPGFRISADGIAVEDGAAGMHIRVRNMGTGEVSRAIVESAGNVVVPGYNYAATGRE